MAGRTLKSFEQWLKKGARGTDYVFPSEMLVQMNVIVDFKNQHRYNEDEFLDRIQADMRSSLMERVSSDFLLVLCSEWLGTSVVSVLDSGAEVMAAYRRVYDSRHLQADCQEPGSAPEPYALLSSMGYLFYLSDSPPL